MEIKTLLKFIFGLVLLLGGPRSWFAALLGLLRRSGSLLRS